MARKGRNEVEESRPPKLVRPRDEVKRLLDEQIQAGRNLLRRQLQTEELLAAANRERRTWSDRTRAILQTAFDTGQIVSEYGHGQHGPMFVDASFQQEIEEFLEGVQDTVNSIISVVQRLDLFDEPPKAGKGADAAAISIQQRDQRKVFIVHGHAEAARDRVARFIHKLGFEPVILSEQASTGQTVIEKIEKHSEVGYAVILFTGDDIGAKAGTEPERLQRRARQNVVLELGYFMAKLGRQSVCVLYESNVEIPSDIAGVVYQQLDSSDAWQLRLAKEMKAAGLPVDMNKAI